MNHVELVQLKVLAMQATSGNFELAQQFFDWIAATSLDAELARRAKQAEAPKIAI
jgi:hypothetical protein